MLPVAMEMILGQYFAMYLSFWKVDEKKGKRKCNLFKLNCL